MNEQERHRRIMNDMARSSAAMKEAKKIVLDLLRDKYPDSEIHQVEGDSNNICQMLDIYGGIDYMLKYTKNGGLIGIAGRTQWIGHNDAVYNSFTTRKTRISGKPTEYEKRKCDIENGYIHPDLTMHLYVDKETNEVISLAVAETKDITDWIDKGKAETRENRDESGKADFYVCWWNDMIADGLDVRIFNSGTHQIISRNNRNRNCIYEDENFWKI